MAENNRIAARPRRPARARIACLVRPGTGIAAALLCLLAPARARAEVTTADRAIAEQLYDRGRARMAAGQIGPACESFAESQRLDPGTGTLLSLAACHEAEGKLASAWVEFREAAVTLHRENRPDRSRYANEHLAAIEPRLAYLTIAVSESAQGHAPVVTLDGRVLGPAVWGVAVPVDAGWHEAAADYGSGSPWRATLKINDGQRRHIDVPGQGAAQSALLDGRPEAQSAAGPAAVETVSTPLGEAHDRPTPKARRFDHARVAGVALGSAGVVALGVAAYSAWHASTLWGQRNRACPMEACTPDGVALGARANSAATVATWTTVGGAVAVGVAAGLFFWPRSTEAPEASKAVAQPPRWARWISALRIEGTSRVTMGASF